MNPTLTRFGIQMSNPSASGIQSIMRDISEALQADKGSELVNLSAGNPVILPEVVQLWKYYTAQLLGSSEYSEIVCRYGVCKGYPPFVEAIVKDFNQRYGLNLSERNILVTPGSQAIYFYAANVLGGYTSDGSLKSIVLPLSPEYVGYSAISLVPEALLAYKPKLEIDEEAHRFKYCPDFGKLKIIQDTGCVIFSRPCNPTGNILSDEEVKEILALAVPHNVPVLIDSAYAPPFPALNFKSMTPMLGDNILHCISFSKAGLPGERVGVVIGDPKLIEVLESFQTNLCVHSSRYGQAIAARAIADGALADIATNVIRCYYRQKLEIFEHALEQSMPKDVPWFLHRSEGSIFAWLWLKDLSITDWEFYQQLKQVGVIVVPGSPFFPGLPENWLHKQQCIRISLTASNKEIEIGVQRLAKVTRQLY
jgi:valine--pyruvate aminotransferase